MAIKCSDGLCTAPSPRTVAGNWDKMVRNEGRQSQIVDDACASSFGRDATYAWILRLKAASHGPINAMVTMSAVDSIDNYQTASLKRACLGGQRNLLGLNACRMQRKYIAYVCSKTNTELSNSNGLTIIVSGTDCAHQLRRGLLRSPARIRGRMA